MAVPMTGTSRFSGLRRLSSDTMLALDRFEEHRRYMTAIAYRMLGSAADAEDAVQDTWVRWQSADRAAIVTARAWLSTVLVRICIDRLTSARARRETYPGTGCLSRS